MSSSSSTKASSTKTNFVTDSSTKSTCIVCNHTFAFGPTDMGNALLTKGSISLQKVPLHYVRCPSEKEMASRVESFEAIGSNILDKCITHEDREDLRARMSDTYDEVEHVSRTGCYKSTLNLGGDEE